MPSSVIAAMDYDHLSGTLTITFVSGIIYAYKSVPEKVFNAMKSAISKGRYFNRYIKGTYAFEKIETT